MVVKSGIIPNVKMLGIWRGGKSDFAKLGRHTILFFNQSDEIEDVYNIRFTHAFLFVPFQPLSLFSLQKWSMLSAAYLIRSRH